MYGSLVYRAKQKQCNERNTNMTSEPSDFTEICLTINQINSNSCECFTALDTLIWRNTLATNFGLHIL